MSLIKKILIIFFLLFPISHSFAATLTHVQTVDFDDGAQSENNLLAGIEFNKDGTKLFTSSANKTNPGLIMEYNLSTPYDISSRSYAGNGERCTMTEVTLTPYDLEFNHDGTKLFLATRSAVNGKDKDKLLRYDLTTPYDISTCQFAQQTTNLDVQANLNDSAAGDFSEAAESDYDTKGGNDSSKIRLQGFEFNNKGTKLFLSWFGLTGNSAKLLEYTLSTPYDITSLQLVTTAGINMGAGTTADVVNSAGIRFSANGKRIFIISHTNNSEGISQISLTNAFDTSSFVMDGKFNLETASPSNQQPRGVAFNSNGLKLYIGNDENDGDVDQIMEYDLVCPFTIFAGTCPSITENSDKTGMAEAQIELARRTIERSTNSTLNRLKWIRRNKDKQNLTNLNINLNFSNQILASLTEVVRTSAAKKNTKDKKQDVFYWSEGSIAVGRMGDTSVSSSKDIETNSLTLGADRFTKNNGIVGLAFRYGRDNTDVGDAGSNLDADTYNLTFYNTRPFDIDTKYIDTIIGIGKIKTDILTVMDGKHLTANRRGKQMYGTVKLKDEIKKNKLTIIPSSQIDFGHTILNAYDEVGTGAISVEKQHVKTRHLRATVAAVHDLENERYSIKRHGKLEYQANLKRSSNLKYTYVSDTSKAFNTKLNPAAFHNINGEIGIDIVLPENYSIFIIYERNQALDYGHTDNIHIALGYLPNKDTEYAFKINGSENLMSKFEIKKDINGFNLSFNLNDDLTNIGNAREANIELNKVF